MNKINKLTVDEQGILHGGYTLHSSRTNGPSDDGNVNKNCSNSGASDSNTNCYCPTICNPPIVIPPKDPPPIKE